MLKKATAFPLLSSELSVISEPEEDATVEETENTTEDEE